MPVHVQLVFCSSDFISLCSMSSGSWIPRDKAQKRTSSNECHLLRKHAFMWLSTNFGKSIPTMAYQTFLFVPHSIKVEVGRAVMFYSVPRRKAEKILMTV